MTPLIKQYSRTALGEMVIMMSLDGYIPLLQYAELTLDRFDTLQSFCAELTFAVDEAVWDEDSIGWYRRYHEIAGLLLRTDMEALLPADRRRFLFWLENGTVATMHSFPHRNLWHKSIAWVLHDHSAVESLDASTFPIVRAFAESVEARLKDSSYSAAKEAFAEGPDSFFDTFQKTKFHINVIPGAIVSQHLIGLNWMRRVHILRQETERFIAEGGDVAILEDTVMRYADARVTSEWLTGYVADRAAFRYDRLWSNTFREPEA
ncbi:hypothetical protein [Jannaschia sp. LMIT008]|uniref:hypothetical protein n=1 Tax=Jannaschia maritima TaxID=3032585 RepID=UPI002811F428|nr:hypothetical protein [Jannaschia sp. LMIT008]